MIEWLQAQLDEDERMALAATPGPWRHNPNKCWRKPGTAWFEEAVFAGPPGAEAICVAGTGEPDDQQSMADAQYITRHDPARVLRDVAAKRRRIARHYPMRDVDWRPCVRCLVEWPCDDLRDDAAVYSDRPGYREEWRPCYRVSESSS